MSNSTTVRYFPLSYAYFNLLSLNASIGSFLRGILFLGFIFTMLATIISHKSDYYQMISISLLHFFAMFGVFLSCEIAERYGRIKCFFVSTVLYCMSAALCSIGYMLKSDAFIFSGIVFSGLTQGVNSFIVPVYSKK